MKKIAEIINSAQVVTIISHKDPDGDTIGSQLGLALLLEKENKQVYCYNIDQIPDYLSFLPGSEKIQTYSGQDLTEGVIIYMDCADYRRAGIPIGTGVTINIDHHLGNDLFADYNYINPKAAATGEIVYELLQEMNLFLDKDSATCLYTAISTDTGSFMFSNTTANTHLITADLIEKGADTNALRENFYEGVSFKRFQLTKYAYQEVNFTCDNLLAWVKIPYVILNQLEAKEEDTEGIAGNLRNVKDVEVALLLRERKDGKIKGSLRSKKRIDVSKIAKVFDGGGHKRAAGFELEGSLDELEKKVINEIKKELKNV